MELVIVAVIVIFIALYNQVIDTKSFISDVKPLVRKLMEADYEFLLRVKYRDKNIDINKLFYNRIRDGILTIALGIFVLAIKIIKAIMKKKNKKMTVSDEEAK